jgi:hypothetical protein
VLARWLFCFLLFPAFFARQSTVGTQYYFDSYREIAAALRTGAGYRLGPEGPPALHRPPGYVAFLALCAPQDAEHCYIWVQLLQGLLGGCSVLLTILAALAFGVASREALFAGWIAALWPFAVWETKVTVPENLLLVLLPAALLALAAAGRSFHWVTLTGLIGAGMALTHPTYQVIVLPLATAIAFLPIGRGRKLISFSLLLITFCIPISLWILRNHRLGYDGVATGFGYNYFRGVYAFNVLLAGGQYFRDHDQPAIAFVNGQLRAAGLGSFDSNLRRSDLSPNALLDERAIQHLEAHPFYSAAKVLIKMPLAWLQQQTPIRSAATALLLAPFFLLAAAGVRRRKSLWIILFTILIVDASFAAVAVEAIPMRYMLPLMSPLAILAGAGLPRREGSAATGAGTVD